MVLGSDSCDLFDRYFSSLIAFINEIAEMTMTIRSGTPTTTEAVWRISIPPIYMRLSATKPNTNAHTNRCHRGGCPSTGKFFEAVAESVNAAESRDVATKINASIKKMMKMILDIGND